MLHWQISITEIDRNDRNTCGLGRVDIGAAVSNHHCAVTISTGFGNCFRQMTRIGLTESKCVRAADSGKAMRFAH
ncbi:hypothetical protein FQZ97_890010 [compost metagenome]